MTANKHILVVEDEEHLAIGIKYALEKAEGYRVTTIADGRVALQTITESSTDVDLVVLDLMLPGMSGYDVCETLRSSGHDIPVLILSARTLTEDRTRGFDVGADQYLTKPFDLDELLSRVKNLLTLYDRRAKERGKSLPVPLQFEFAEAVINFETFEVTVAEKPVRLTQLEMKLLRYFIENEGRVIPRSELLENVWNTAGTITTRAPDQFIRRLRKAFEPDPAAPIHFLTIRDAGYRFVAAPE
ncbi:MAG: response regulator transcription factor [Planctomycetes bacterium]|nr:response regulator transcription factor [Planctomycetota bacterium]